MQVFKAFLKVINKHKGQMIMYLCIFSGLLSAFILSGNSESTSYISQKVDFAVFDYDDSEESRLLIEYLEDKQKMKTIKSDDKETIQDELFVRNVDCVLRIESGYGESVRNGKGGHLEVVTIPNTFTSVTFENSINEYESMVNAYVTAGYSSKEAINKTMKTLDTSIDVSLPEGKESGTRSMMGTFFIYLGWVLLAMIITGITPVLQVFMRKELRNRIQCSSYHFIRFNKELLMGVICTGAIVVVAILVIFNIVIPGKLFTTKGLFMVINMVCYLLFALSLAFLISKLTTNEQIISMISNIISLGMAFLCGVFVPVELLSEGVLRVAHFLPAYWYCAAVNSIEESVAENTSKILSCCGIELLYAVAIIVIAMVIERKVKLEAA